ncbi:TlpA disulfide reductase family protein [Hoylesella nanceiensis]|uniref:peroxiredoxin family protein n=1 Tax=Hoylesella nanceiensis TaxID=425941 RepID=UPI0028E56CE7|nr:TlpA disulfide reductase family protein [Hoylesella nanceiensis]
MKNWILLLVLLTAFCAPIKAQLPQITLKGIDGKSVRLDTISNNEKPIIVSFFATWCKPCNRELSAINEVYDEWQKETGVKLVAISIDQAQNVNKVKPLVDANGWKYEVLLDPNGEVRRAVGAQMIPFVLVLDKNKNIVYKHSGYADGSENELYEKVKEACKK